MYHCIICHNQFDLKSIWYDENEEPGLCVSCLYTADPTLFPTQNVDNWQALEPCPLCS